MNFRLLPVLAILALIPAHSRAQNGTVFLSGKDLDYMGYQSGILFWKATCLFAASPRSLIERTPAGSPAVATYFHPPTCTGFSVRSDNVAMDAARNVYWATNDGRIVKLDAAADPSSTPVVLGQMASTQLPQSVHVSVSPAYVYWAETFGEFSENGNLYRVPLAGGTREIVLNYTQAGGGGIVALHALGGNGLTPGESILYKRSFGKLARATEQIVLPGQNPWSEATVVNSIDVFKVVGGRNYYAETVSGGATTIKSRNVNGVANIQTHATLSTAGSPYVSDIAADSSAVYWRETRSQTGPIWRQMLSGGTPAAITVNLPSSSFDRMFLESDGRALFWRSSQTEIRTLPVNAGAIVYDVQGRAVEVVQTIQGPANDVPLVAGKTTWVRAFGRFSVSGASTTRLERLSLAQLHGTRGGTPLPGSPLQSMGGDSVLLTTDADRTVESAGSWFRLPMEWTSGNVVLHAEFNAERVVPETSFANNSVATAVSFNPRKSIHLRVYPLRTNQGTIDGYLPDYQPVLDLAEALLPTPEITVNFGGITLEEWEPQFLNPFNFGPYELSQSDDDSGWVLFKLGLRTVLQTATVPVDILLGRSVHDMAFFRPFEQRAFNGIGRLGYPKVLLSYMRLGAGASGFNTPLGGVTLAHEIGHNYGRDHVDCGSPADPDPNYPYNDCNIAGAVPYQGWNPISRRMIRGTDAGDLMSYRGNTGELGQRWTSDYTWRALYNEIGAPLLGAPAPAPRTPRDGEPSILLGGVVHPGGIAELHPAIPLPDAASKAAAAAMVAGSDNLTTWSFVVRRANGTLLRTIPAGVSESTDDGPLLVHAVADEDPLAATVMLQVNNAPGIPQATMAGGGAPPTVAITAPVAGAVVSGAFTLRWDAADPENQPLRFLVRYSNDQGATWRLISAETRANELAIDATTLPGGAANDAQLEVLASDGLRTATAKSAFFTIPAKAPRPVIVIETDRGRSCGATPFIAAGETLTLRGSASDVEDEAIASTSLAWTVTGSTGITRTGAGRELLLRDLPPATYSVQLRATDSDNQTGNATATFGVRAFAIAGAAAAPVVDGLGDDAAYLSCPHPLHLRYATGAPATVRAVIFGTTLYVAMTGLATGAASPGDLVSIGFDPNNRGETAAQATDIRFIATRDGEFYSARGDGAGGFDATKLTTGFTVRVAGDSTRWHAEYAIPLATIGATAGQLIGMDVSHAWVASAGDDYHWLSAAQTAWNRPRDWADVRLAADADDPADQDLDGMADAWELTNFGSTNGFGTADTDGDGQLDVVEFQAGTDPNSRLSRFVMSGFVPEGAFLRASWPSATGSLYTVETSDDLNEWEPYCTNLPGTGTPLSCLINPALPEAGRFFRVKAQRCPQ